MFHGFAVALTWYNIGMMAIGIVLGIIVAQLAAVLQFGSYGVQHFPWSKSGYVSLGSLLGGVLLAVTGALYPAVMAARMRPVQATLERTFEVASSLVASRASSRMPT